MSCLKRLGSGQRSRGVWSFLFLISRLAPLETRKMAIEALLFFSVLLVMMAWKKVLGGRWGVWEG